MTDFILPRDFPPAQAEWGHRDSSAASVSDTSGAVLTSSVVGGNLRTARLSFPKTRNQTSNGSLRGRMQAAIDRMRGQSNRLWITPPGYVRQGSFPASELLSNNTFENGTTGWTSNGQHSISASGRVLRMARAAVTSPNGEVTAAASTVTQYAPYCARALYQPGRGSFTSLRTVFSGVTGGTAVASGLAQVAAVSSSTSLTFGLSDQQASALNPGDYFLVPYTSLSRCALVDGGGNLLLRSNTFENAGWTKTNSAVADNGTVPIAPDGNTAGNPRSLQENTTSGVHRIEQTVTVAAASVDYMLSCYVRAETRNWCYLQMQEGAGSTNLIAYFNASTGAVGTLSSGANWSNARAFAVSVGNGWWQFFVIGRTVSTTSITAMIGAANADNSASYAGVSSAIAHLIWNATLKQSSSPSRTRTPTTSAALSAETQSGTGIHLKGLPASTSGLLLPGDWVQIGNSLEMVAAPLDSDAAGCGYLQLTRYLKTPAADNAPVIVNEPMGRFLFGQPAGSWLDTPGVFSEFELDLLEAVDA